ncbi:MAG: AMP-binding protein [Gammaproteobacteria bacterium]|nr:AMP-binding protein [Gammaproteobacteria bacterium]
MSKERDGRASIALYKGCLIDWCTFENHVAQTRLNILRNFSDVGRYAPKILNLCEDRYHFLVVFTANILEGRTTVMPANRSEGELERLTVINNDIQLINDSEIAAICQIDLLDSSNGVPWDINLVPDTMIVAELYTSGSTGAPSANPKTWAQLVNGAQQVCVRFGLDIFSQTSIIATVPPQHMFGFEMSIVLPLICGVTIHQGQPFYPLDIQHALCEMPSPRILVTTPIHLKACVTLKNNWPDIEFVMSATAPLYEEVAHQIEAVLNTDVKEVYGCSEVGAIATRHMTRDLNWKLLPDYSLTVDDGAALFNAPKILEPISLPDKFEILPDGYFQLVGRASDMIKIGGKRGSLADITARIKSLPGVDDAAVFRSEHKENQRERLAALVVAPSLTSEQLREALLYEIDPIFLPRPLCVVPVLPYNSTGKLTKADLLISLDNHTKEKKLC